MNVLQFRSLLFAACLLRAAAASVSAATVTLSPTADTFLTAGSSDPNAGQPTLNYGAAGALQVSAAGEAKGEIQTLLKFDLSTAKATFDTMYGAGNWMVTSITLELGTNFGTQGSQPNNAIFNAINGGRFAIDWLSNDNWGEGSGTPASGFNPANPPVDGATYATLNSLLSAMDETLGTYTYTPVGNTNPPTIPAATYGLGLNSGFLSDVTAGSTVSLRAYAADTGVSYLFNARSFPTTSNEPALIVTAAAVPEPGSMTLLGSVALLGLARTRRRTHAA